MLYYSQLNPLFIQIFLSFLLMSFPFILFCLRISSGPTLHFSCYVFSAFSRLCTVSSEFPCFWWPWKFGGTLVRYFVGWHSKTCYPVLITRLNRSYRFRRKMKNKTPFLLHCFRYILPTWLISVMLTVIT